MLGTKTALLASLGAMLGTKTALLASLGAMLGPKTALLASLGAELLGTWTKTLLMESLGATLLAELGMAKLPATLGAPQLMLEGAAQLLEGAKLEDELLPHCVGASLAVDDLIGLAVGAELAIGAPSAPCSGGATARRLRKLRSTKRLTCTIQHFAEFLLRTGHV